MCDVDGKRVFKCTEMSSMISTSSPTTFGGQPDLAKVPRLSPSKSVQPPTADKQLATRREHHRRCYRPQQQTGYDRARRRRCCSRCIEWSNDTVQAEEERRRGREIAISYNFLESLFVCYPRRPPPPMDKTTFFLPFFPPCFPPPPPPAAPTPCSPATPSPSCPSA